jgi:hypothetical protein
VPDTVDLERYWASRDYSGVVEALTRLRAAAAQAARADERVALADAIRRFLTVERLNILLLDFIGGALPAPMASRIWDFVPDEVIWPVLLDAWILLPDGENRDVVLAVLRRLVSANGGLLHRGRSVPDNLIQLLR